jgi:hypothetical protein
MDEIINDQILHCLLGPNVANEELKNDKLYKIKEVIMLTWTILRDFLMKDSLHVRFQEISLKKKNTRA